MFMAMLVAGIWIAAFCTAPQLLGSYVWKRFGFATDLPLNDLVKVSLNSCAVLSLVVLSRRSALLVPKRPAKPAVILLFLPLLTVNFTRGPMVEAGAAFVLVTVASTLLTGFWEEFLFRGVIQDRLAVLGGRLSLLMTALMFALIHWNAGIIQVSVAFSIGLAFCVARDSVGMWTLVLMHATIDFTKELFQKQWESHYLLALIVVGACLVVSAVFLVKRKRA